jgi:hypothetical protein
MRLRQAGDLQVPGVRMVGHWTSAGQHAPEAALEIRADSGMSPLWWATKDGDRDCLALYERHYSAHRYRDGRERRLFVGPGTKRVFRTWEGDACFAWREFIDDSGQDGICCCFFRNESSHRSSELIRQADAIADALWPHRRHYTQVDAAAVQSTNPGYCFLCAGWKRCGVTKSGLLVLERPAV